MNAAAAVYSWERAICPPELWPASVVRKRPFSAEFVAFYHEAWAWGVERFAPTCRDLPELRFNLRLRRAAGIAGLVWVKRGGEFLVPGITLSFHGITRKTLLHETAHHLAGLRVDHGPAFCRVALDLYVQFLGVDEARAIEVAVVHGVQVAPPPSEGQP